MYAAGFGTGFPCSVGSSEITLGSEHLCLHGVAVGLTGETMDILVDVVEVESSVACARQEDETGGLRCLGRQLLADEYITVVRGVGVEGRGLEVVDVGGTDGVGLILAGFCVHLNKS